jgi:hypothetical protein
MEQLLQRLRKLLGREVTVSPEVDLKSLEPQILICEAAKSELDAIHDLLRLVDEKERALRRINLPGVMIHQHAFEGPRDNRPETLRMLHELRTAAYGKVVVLEGKDEGQGPRLWRIAQANYGFPDIGIVNRQSPLARALVSAEVGDKVTLPKGVFRVGAIELLERFPPEQRNNAENFQRLERSDSSDVRIVLEDLAESFRVRLEVLRSALGDEERVAAPVAELREEPEPREIGRGDTERLSANFYTRNEQAAGRTDAALGGRASGYSRGCRLREDLGCSRSNQGAV